MNELGEVLALIPARGGSKSVPRKNLVMLLGKPMIAWPIEHALASRYISRVIVTTDDREIAEAARAHGAEVPFLRPAEISGDLSLDVEFHRHALMWLRENEGYDPDMIVNLRPTPPARSPDLIDQAISLFAARPDVDSVRSVQLAQESPFKMWLMAEDDCLRPVTSLAGFREPYNEPRQKLPLVYWQNGYIDVTRPSVVLEQNSTTGHRILPFIMDEPVADVDYPEEVGLAEAQLRRHQKGTHPVVTPKDADIRRPS